MKAKMAEADKFSPFDLVLTVETAEDARALYALFNYIPNTNLFEEDFPLKIRDILGSHGGRTESDAEIARGVAYHDFYRSKK
jgi:hypothetical protein